MFNGLISVLIFLAILFWAMPNIDGMTFTTYATKHGYKAAIVRVWEGPPAQTTTTIMKGSHNE
jgi:hypothetical protein